MMAVLGKYERLRMWKGESQGTGDRRMSWGHWALEDGGSPWLPWESADRTGDGGQRRMLKTELCPVFFLCSEFKCVSPNFSNTGLGGIFYCLKVYSVCFGEFCFQVELRRYRERTHAHARTHMRTCVCVDSNTYLPYLSFFSTCATVPIISIFPQSTSSTTVEGSLLSHHNTTVTQRS